MFGKNTPGLKMYSFPPKNVSMIIDICSQVMTRKIQFNYKRSFKTPEGKQRYIYAADIEKKYSVKLEAWHNVQIQVCSTNTNVDYATVTGQVVFHNPYGNYMSYRLALLTHSYIHGIGFISGELYGMLPFQVTSYNVMY